MLVLVWFKNDERTLFIGQEVWKARQDRIEGFLQVGLRGKNGIFAFNAHG